ncbi:hypothetical protein HK405_003410, partial [Cladochytrium tenue]
WRAVFDAHLRDVPKYADRRRRDDEAHDREEARRDELRCTEKVQLAESERRRIQDAHHDRMAALEARGTELALEIKALGGTSVATLSDSGDAARATAVPPPSVELDLNHSN